MGSMSVALAPRVTIVWFSLTVVEHLDNELGSVYTEMEITPKRSQKQA